MIGSSPGRCTQSDTLLVFSFFICAISGHCRSVAALRVQVLTLEGQLFMWLLLRMGASCLNAPAIVKMASCCLPAIEEKITSCVERNWFIMSAIRPSFRLSILCSMRHSWSLFQVHENVDNLADFAHHCASSCILFSWWPCPVHCNKNCWCAKFAYNRLFNFVMSLWISCENACNRHICFIDILQVGFCLDADSKRDF